MGIVDSEMYRITKLYFIFSSMQVKEKGKFLVKIVTQ